jgi:REP element-mobilizing transposase RayT
MARPLRVEVEGGLFHVTSRGDGREEIFIDEGDRIVFLGVLERVVARQGWLCHAYCLMGNHYHLLLETPRANLSQGMRQLNGVYTQRFNLRHHREGHVFQGRFRSILVDREGYLLELCRYVVLNPVRANLAGEPADWRWSSYRATVGLEPVPPFLTVDWVLGQFGANRETARMRYREFIREGIGQASPWPNLKGGVFLGDEEFLRGFGSLLEGKGKEDEVPRTQRCAARPSLETLFAPGGIGRTELEARIHRGFTEFGYTQKEMADFLHFHRSTISLMIRRREKKTDISRPDPEVGVRGGWGS